MLVLPTLKKVSPPMDSLYLTLGYFWAAMLWGCSQQDLSRQGLQKKTKRLLLLLRCFLFLCVTVTILFLVFIPTSH